MKHKEPKHVAEFRWRHLRPDETIELFLENSQRNGMLILTSERACLYRKGLWGEALEAVPVNRITAVEARSILGHHVIRLLGPPEPLVFKTFDRRDLVDALCARLDELRRADPAPAPADGPMEHLKRLGALRDAGILTEGEFDAKKAEILSKF
ncbi:SHOCT domain-containing protein [Inquilinus sp. OTU3971]|uniref:SHOCT domain-containing protein n=1 Tax=Inquilinus sp. OTU3971 TaxID=3043855 RepID=UPI00313B0598